MTSRRGMSLLVAGFTSEAIYLAVTIRLPWWHYGGTLTSWWQILGQGQEPLIACLAGVGVLMAAYLLGLQAVRRRPPGAEARWVIWVGAILFSSTLFWLMPITSDLFTYLSHAHMLTDLGANPLLHAPLDLSADRVLLAYPTFYASYPSIYGPAWVLVSALGTLGRYDVACGLFYLKGLAITSYLGCAWLLERILRRTRPTFAMEVLYLFAWNPLVLLMAVGDGHNDIVMMAAVLLAVWLLLREQWLSASAVLALSVWIKYVSVVFVPLFLLYAWHRAGKGHEHRPWRVMAQVSLGIIGISVVVLLPLGYPGWMANALERLIRPLNARGGLSSPAVWILGAGLLSFAVTYARFASQVARRHNSLRGVTDIAFIVSVSIFLLGMVRSQPWHLLWPAALAGLSSRKWAWPTVVGLSAVMLAVQVWVEWGAPGMPIAS